MPTAASSTISSREVDNIGECQPLDLVEPERTPMAAELPDPHEVDSNGRILPATRAPYLENKRFSVVARNQRGTSSRHVLHDVPGRQLVLS
jgi:hypothetical protein